MQRIEFLNRVRGTVLFNFSPILLSSHPLNRNVVFNPLAFWEPLGVDGTFVSWPVCDVRRETCNSRDP